MRRRGAAPTAGMAQRPPAPRMPPRARPRHVPPLPQPTPDATPRTRASLQLRLRAALAALEAHYGHPAGHGLWDVARPVRMGTEAGADGDEAPGAVAEALLGDVAGAVEGVAGRAASETSRQLRAFELGAHAGTVAAARVPADKAPRRRGRPQPVAESDAEVDLLASGLPRLSSGALSRLRGVMVFVNSSTSAQLTVTLLRRLGVPCAGVHKEATARARLDALQQFRDGRLPVLVCTDLASRGLDLPRAEHIVQLDFAPDAMSFIHRVGRTARAAGEGMGAWPAGHSSARISSRLVRTHPCAVTSVVGPENKLLMDCLLLAGDDADLSGWFSHRRSLRRKAKKAGSAGGAAAEAGAQEGT